MRILSLFSGIGAFEKALKNIGIDIDLVAFCEFDKYATKSYCAIHGVDESLNLGDITKVDEKTLPKDIDLITYGFPCQDISLAGKKQGMFNEDGTHTRSGLFFDALRIIEETKPKYAIAENVKNLVSKRFNAQFQVVLASLDAAGYNSYYKVLNAKDYGIPQNRERVFIVSIRKDIDNGTFAFPKGFPLDLRLRDLLEPEVDEKFYLSETGFKLFQKQDETRVDRTTMDSEVTVLTMAHGFDPGCEKDADVLPTLTTRTCTNWHTVIKEKTPGYIVREGTKKGYAFATEGDSINVAFPTSFNRRARVGKQMANTLTAAPTQAVVVNPHVVGGIGEKKSNHGTQWYQQDRVYEDNVALSVSTRLNPYYEIETPCAYDEQNEYIRKDGCVGTITTDGSSPKHNNRVIENGYRIRKLTPKECFRLMGFDDEDFEKAQAINSNTQLYKQAGNSIVVDVLEYLLTELFVKL